MVWIAYDEKSFPIIDESLSILAAITLLSPNTNILCLCSFPSLIVKNDGAPVLCPAIYLTS